MEPMHALQLDAAALHGMRRSPGPVQIIKIAQGSKAGQVFWKGLQLLDE